MKPIIISLMLWSGMALGAQIVSPPSNDNEEEITRVMAEKFQSARLPTADDLKLGFTWQCAAISAIHNSDRANVFRFIPLASGLYNNAGSHWSKSFVASTQSIIATAPCSDRRFTKYKKRISLRVDFEGNLIGKEISECEWRGDNAFYYACPLVLVENTENAK